MPRANRYHLPGQIWHITHRCHNRDFLLKFKKDRDRYRHWLWESHRRYGLCLLNYILTSNHIHLIVYEDGNCRTIQRSMQLAQGRIAQEFNNRNHRLGAFWQDRYHATAIQSHQHLRRCMTYIDMNMVRARVVEHPADWPSAGYHEIQNPPQRYRLLDLERLMQTLGFGDHKQLVTWQRDQIREALKKPQVRQDHWSSAVAIGNKAFLENVSRQLAIRARHRNISQHGDNWVLQEPMGGPYKFIKAPKMDI